MPIQRANPVRSLQIWFVDSPQASPINKRGVKKTEIVLIVNKEPKVQDDFVKIKGTVASQLGLLGPECHK